MYAHKLTVIARGTYIPQTEEIVDPRRLRLLNEVQHRVTAHLRHLISGSMKRYPEDVNMPEILLREGMLFRQMGAPEMAMARFYGVMTGSLKLKFGSLEYYQRLVLQV